MSCPRLAWLFISPSIPRRHSPQSVLVRLQHLMAGVHGGKSRIPERGGEGVSGLPPLTKRDMRLWPCVRLSFDTVVPNSCMETETSTRPGVESGGSLCHAMTFSEETSFSPSSQILKSHYGQWQLLWKPMLRTKSSQKGLFADVSDISHFLSHYWHQYLTPF